MAPTTRRTSRVTPPPNRSEPGEADTIRKNRLYNALDAKPKKQSMHAFCNEIGETESTGRLWKKQRENLGSMAYRSLRKRSTKLGRRSKVTKSICQMLVDPYRNPVRDQVWEAQIEYHQLPVKRRQLRRKLKEHTNGGQKYKCAFVKKEISNKNKQERVEYGEEHKDKEVEDFWSYIFFTDETHIDPTLQAVGDILRERGTRYDDENIQERREKKGITLHVAAWITWHNKAEKLEFYNNEEDHTIRPPMPSKPRRHPTTESEADYQLKLKEWEALKPYAVEVKVGGNHITQKYYTDRLLPVYIDAIQKAQIRDSGLWLLQEDGDPSHGMKKKGLAYKLKQDNWIVNLKHPAQSPDLNPIEGIWNIIKQRLRRKVFHSEEELKQALQEEWDKITMTEI